MATAERTTADRPNEGLAVRQSRRRRAASPAAEPFTDRTQWTVTSGDRETDVASRAAAWSVAIDAYERGQSVLVRSTA